LISSLFGRRIRESTTLAAMPRALIPSPFGGRVRERGAAQSAANLFWRLPSES
jgi:hypothetical protein